MWNRMEMVNMTLKVDRLIYTCSKTFVEGKTNTDWSQRD
jgi:hypothetical protein